MTTPATQAHPAPIGADPMNPVLWALMLGNMVIGTGVMVVPGTLPNIASSLEVSIAAAGQIISASGLLMCIGAPALAMALGKWDRRWMLTLVMLWYGLSHWLCMAATTYPQLLVLRLLAMIGPALFTPQAAAAVSQLVPLAQRAKAMGFVFLGWSIAAVVGVPLSAWLGGQFGWRVAFGLVGTLGVLNAIWLWRVLPGPIKPPPMPLQAWGRVFGHRALMQTVSITLIASSGQFALFAYFTPYLTEFMGATPKDLALFFAFNGVLGFVGMLVLTRRIDRLGPAAIVTFSLVAFLISSVAWGWASGLLSAMLAITPWALVTFAMNSSQQARLAHIEPAAASASIALNTSAMYMGQAVGAAMGGWMVSQGLIHQLHWLTAAFLLVAMAVNRSLRLRDRA